LALAVEESSNSNAKHSLRRPGLFAVAAGAGSAVVVRRAVFNRRLL